MLVGSITELTLEDRDLVVLTGSHGGSLPARYALRCGLRALICHDAGIGLDEAGVQGLGLLEEAGVPAAAVSHMSARIGDAGDMHARGVLSRVNAAAAALGLAQGMPAAEALALLQRSAPVCEFVRQPETDAPVFQRRSIDETIPARAYDSAAKLSTADDGAVLFTGSHGGLPGSDPGRASKARARFIAFNDAGIGIDDAGIRRLAALDARRIPAACVDAATAHIGDGMSTYETGVISTLNDAAAALGLAAGMPVRSIVTLIDRDAVN